jgi:hypothetical protein
MPKKNVNEATIAPPPVSDASVPEIKKTRKKVTVASAAETPAKPAAPRRKAAVKIANGNTSIGQLADAVDSPSAFDAREIEERAYQSWIERGCPMGSPEEDWYRAERELIARFATSSR